MSEVRPIVIEALQEAAGVLDDPALAPRILDEAGDVPLAELNLDSLTTLETIMELEDRLDIELDLDEVTERQSLNDLVRFIESRMR